MKFNANTYTFTDPGRFGRIMAIAGVVGVLATAAGYFVDADQFFFSWLVAFSFWVTLAIGGLFMVMVHHLTGATWSVVIRRQGEAVGMTLVLFFLLAAPLLAGVHHVYPWTDEKLMHSIPALEGKLPYLNAPFFAIRTLLYFAVWIFLAWTLWRISLRQDGGWEAEAKSKLLRTSAPGMIAFAIVTTFAAFDWWMSLQPLWYSTIYGVYFFSGGIVSVMAFFAILVHALHAKGILKDVITVEHKHDIGKLLFAFMIFWAYMGLSQYLLIWYANLPEETAFFKERWVGSWKAVSVLLAVGGFAVPFVLLMSRHTKRSPWGLTLFAVWLLIMHWVDVWWNVMPVLHPDGVVLSWMDLTAFVGIGGLFLAFFWRLYTRAPVVPPTDPKLEDSIHFVNQ
jgi:hypothetical protein